MSCFVPLLAGVAALAAPPTSPQAPEITLWELVRYADVIAVGRVEEVRMVRRPPEQREEDGVIFDRLGDEVPFARVAIRTLLKGPEGSVGLGDPELLPSVAFLAASLTPCDVTTAVVGEEALFFFVRPGRRSILDPATCEAISRTYPGSDPLLLAWSGHGRMPTRPAVEGLTVAPSGVRLPEGIEDEVHGDPKLAPLDRSMPLEKLARWIGDCSKAQRETWLEARVDGGGPGFAWRLSITWDRRATLSVQESSRERVVEFTVNGGDALGLCGALETDGGFATPVTIGERPAALGTRTLRIHGRDRAADVKILGLDETWMAEPARAKTTKDVLETWRRIRDLFDEPGCADHRAGDVEWLSRK